MFSDGLVGLSPKSEDDRTDTDLVESLIRQMKKNGAIEKGMMSLNI